MFELKFDAEPGLIKYEALEALKAWCVEVVSPYVGKEVTPALVKEAKSDLANLRKVKAQLEDERKRLKKICMKPYEEFEAKYKASISTLVEYEYSLDSQIKDLEEKERVQKVETLEAFIKEEADRVNPALYNFIKYNSQVTAWFWDSSWENKSKSLAKCKEEIATKVQKLNSDIRAINDHENSSDFLTCYINAECDMGEALIYLKKIEEQKAALLKAREEKKEAQEERPKFTYKDAYKMASDEIIHEIEKFRFTSIPEELNEKVHLSVSLTGSKIELKLILNALREVGIDIQTL